MGDRLRKWRLILGREAAPPASPEPERGKTEPEENLRAASPEEEAAGADAKRPASGSAHPYGLTRNDSGMDRVLEALYDSDREGGLGSSAPNVNRWLGDIRTYFPSSVVRILQKDALERLGLEQMLLEPELLESLEPDVSLVATLLSLSQVLPDKTRDSARSVVQRLVEEIEKQLRQPLEEAVRGSLHRQTPNRRPKYNEIDWPRTIRANLKHYQPAYRTIIPEQLYGYGRKGPQLRHIILLIDQSGSMATSLVYAGVIGSLLASLPALRTHLVVFDTAVADLTHELKDPVDLLFGVQLGGGTDIGKALGYASSLIQRPDETIVFLLSDLFEGGRAEIMLDRAARIRSSGAQLIALLALNDSGAPAYDRELATQLASLQIPAFATTPDLFPQLLAAAIEKKDIRQWTHRAGIVLKN